MRHTDPYVYPDTDILINKFDCHDADKLNELEALSSAGNLAYLQLHPIEGQFDFGHLKEIHRFIFQDIFDWAGKVRTIDIGKGNLFCRAVILFGSFAREQQKEDDASFDNAERYGSSD